MLPISRVRLGLRRSAASGEERWVIYDAKEEELMFYIFG